MMPGWNQIRQSRYNSGNNYQNDGQQHSRFRGPSQPRIGVNNNQQDYYNQQQGQGNNQRMPYQQQNMMGMGHQHGMQQWQGNDNYNMMNQNYGSNARMNRPPHPVPPPSGRYPPPPMGMPGNRVPPHMPPQPVPPPGGQPPPPPDDPKPPSDPKPPPPPAEPFKPPAPDEIKWWDAELKQLGVESLRDALKRLLQEDWFLKLSTVQQKECWGHKKNLVIKKHSSTAASTVVEPVSYNMPHHAHSRSNSSTQNTYNINSNLTNASGSGESLEQQLKAQEALLQNYRKQDKTFDDQYAKWKQQFDDWKAKHAAHPNKDQFEKYAMQWKNWQDQMMKQKDQNNMNISKATKIIDEIKSKMQKTSVHVSSNSSSYSSAAQGYKTSVPPFPNTFDKKDFISPTYSNYASKAPTRYTKTTSTTSSNSYSDDIFTSNDFSTKTDEVIPQLKSYDKKYCNPTATAPKPVLENPDEYEQLLLNAYDNMPSSGPAAITAQLYGDNINNFSSARGRGNNFNSSSFDGNSWGRGNRGRGRGNRASQEDLFARVQQQKAQVGNATKQNLMGQAGSNVASLHEQLDAGNDFGVGDGPFEDDGEIDLLLTIPNRSSLSNQFVGGRGRGRFQRGHFRGAQRGGGFGGQRFPNAAFPPRPPKLPLLPPGGQYPLELPPMLDDEKEEYTKQLLQRLNELEREREELALGLKTGITSKELLAKTALPVKTTDLLVAKTNELLAKSSDKPTVDPSVLQKAKAISSLDLQNILSAVKTVQKTDPLPTSSMDASGNEGLGPLPHGAPSVKEEGEENNTNCDTVVEAGAEDIMKEILNDPVTKQNEEIERELIRKTLLEKQAMVRESLEYKTVHKKVETVDYGHGRIKHELPFDDRREFIHNEQRSMERQRRSLSRERHSMERRRERIDREYHQSGHYEERMKRESSLERLRQLEADLRNKEMALNRRQDELMHMLGRGPPMDGRPPPPWDEPPPRFRSPGRRSPGRRSPGRRSPGTGRSPPRFRGSPPRHEQNFQRRPAYSGFPEGGGGDPSAMDGRRSPPDPVKKKRGDSPDEYFIYDENNEPVPVDNFVSRQARQSRIAQMEEEERERKRRINERGMQRERELRARDREIREKRERDARERRRDRERRERRDRSRSRSPRSRSRSPSYSKYSLDRGDGNRSGRDIFGRDIPKHEMSYRDSPVSVAKTPVKNINVGGEFTAVTISVEDILNDPARQKRPRKIVIILRGLPGSGKTHIAKLIRDHETSKGVTPRVLSLDDYFINEKMEYEYEQELEASYRDSLLKSFKKTLEDGYFSFVIVDAVNDKVQHFNDFWTTAKKSGFEVYVAELSLDIETCEKRNIHSRTMTELQSIQNSWDKTPSHMIKLDLRQMMQNSEIQEVEMGDVSEEEVEKEVEAEIKSQEDMAQSKWEKMEATKKLDKLDGIKKAKPQHQSMEEFLSVTDDYVERHSEPGKKRVRWADIEEKKSQKRMRDVGFVVGNTDWDRMLNDSHADKALNRTKFI